MNPWEAYCQAMQSGQYFLAHEILEIPWRQNHGAKYQWAIWIAAAFVHWARGEFPGALKLLERAQENPEMLDPSLMLSIAQWTRRVKQQLPTPEIDDAIWHHIADWGQQI